MGDLSPPQPLQGQGVGTDILIPIFTVRKEKQRRMTCPRPPLSGSDRVGTGPQHPFTEGLALALVLNKSSLGAASAQHGRRPGAGEVVTEMETFNLSLEVGVGAHLTRGWEKDVPGGRPSVVRGV